MSAHHVGRRVSTRVLVLGLLAALAAGGAAGALVVGAHSSAGHRAAGGQLVRHKTTTTGAGAPTTVAATATTSTAPRAPRTLRLVAAAPASGSSAIAGNATLTLTFSSPLAADSAHPRLSPATPGAWSVTGDALRFTPTAPFVPLSSLTVRVPAGRAGVRSRTGALLPAAVVEHYRVQNGSIFRLQQLLSLLQYSPLAFSSPAGPLAPNDTAAQLTALYHAPKGTFSWRQSGWPHALVALWQPGVDNVFTQGLIMEFQADHGLIPNGSITASLWLALVQALSAHTVNTGGYNYAVANKTPPESFTLYHNGAVVLHTPANTGISQTPTPDGTFPVYERLRNQVMRGTNPDGSHYADPVQFVAYFFHSDAVHFMPRADYGIPQSLGCIELPYAAAAKTWPYLAYGTLVTVEN